MDCAYWFGETPEGCDVPYWIPFLTADELGLGRAKLMRDWRTGEVTVSEPTPQTESESDSGEAA